MKRSGNKLLCFYGRLRSKMGVKVYCSLFVAISLMMLSYWSSNTLSYFSGEKTMLSKYETFKNLFRERKATDFDTDSVLYINVGYDKILRPYRTGDFDEVQGRVGVTDPNKLCKLLSQLKENDNYKYIILDVFFEKGLSLPEDSMLHQLILSTPRLVIPNHRNRAIADSALLRKSAIADYKVNFADRDFVKYPFMVDGQPSIALKMYQDLTGHRMTKSGPIYHEGNRIVRNAPIIVFETGLSQLSKYNGEIKSWYNLGFDMLDDSIAGTDEKGENLLREKPDIAANKYIVIGAMDTDDMHYTYLGEVPGPMIHLNAYLTLAKGKHKYSYLMLICMFFTYFALTLLALSGLSLRDYLKQKAKAKNAGKNLVSQTRKGGERLKRLIIRGSAYMVSFAGCLMLLIIPDLFLYEFYGEVYEVLLLTVLFTALPMIFKTTRRIYSKTIKTKKSHKWNQTKEEPSFQL